MSINIYEYMHFRLLSRLVYLKAESKTYLINEKPNTCALGTIFLLNENQSELITTN